MHTISINMLAKQMQFRKEQGEIPYLLFLGAGASISSGVSGTNEMINQFLIDFGIANYETLKKMDRYERFERFFRKIENLSMADRFFWLEAVYKYRQPSVGYIALTHLIENGYFDVIITTNYDSLLDLSLERSPILKNKRDFRFYVRGVDNDDFIIQSFKKYSPPPTKILKLHGELESQVIFTSSEENANVSKEMAGLLKSLFRHRSVIMIGYSVLDKDISMFIERNTNTLIYINPKISREQTVTSFLNRFERVLKISKSNAEFDILMKDLRDILLKKNVEQVKETSISKEKKYNLQQIEKKLNELFEPEEGQRWLHTPQAIFNGYRPVDIIDQDGTDRVMQILECLEEGSHI